MKLSNNFSLKEMTTSQMATRHGINNNPSEDHMNNLKALCENVLQKVRDHYGKVVSISRGIEVQSCVLRLAQVSIHSTLLATPPILKSMVLVMQTYVNILQKTWSLTN